jgi:hypothetical protein
MRTQTITVVQCITRLGDAWAQACINIACQQISHGTGAQVISLLSLHTTLQ